MTVIDYPAPDLAALYRALAAEMDRLAGAVHEPDGQHGLWGPHAVALRDRQRFNRAWERVAADVAGLRRAHKEQLWCQWRDNTRRMRKGAA